MLFASELNGSNIGDRIIFYEGYREITTNNITMITHKKNGKVRIRCGKNNAEYDLDGDTNILDVLYDE